MKRFRTQRRWLRGAWVLAGVAGVGLSEVLVIQSFDGTGRLSFNTLASATNYCVEWAPSPEGPWTNTWAPLINIPTPVSGSVTCAVPMCYRVVATAVPPEEPALTNATLANVYLSKGTLVPAFQPDVLSYTVRLNANDDSPGTLGEMQAFMMPVVSNGNPEVDISIDTLSTSWPVTSGSFLPAVTLPQGVNTFRLQVTAENNLTSQVYAIAAECDFVPPNIGSPLLSLTPSSAYVFSDPNSPDVQCSFVGPGNDGWDGTCAQVVAKYSTAPIYAAEWEMASTVGSWSNLTGGTVYSYDVSIPDADRGKTVYIALRAFDAVSNASAVGVASIDVPTQSGRYVDYYLSVADVAWKLDYNETLNLMATACEGLGYELFQIAVYAGRNDPSFDYASWYICLLDEISSNQEFVRASDTNCFEVFEAPAKIVHRYVDSDGTTVQTRESTLTSDDKTALKSEMRAFLNSYVGDHWEEYKTIDPEW